MKLKFLQIPALVFAMCGALVIPPTAVALGTTPDQDKKDKQEMGSDKQTGGPTQKDRDTMSDINKGSKDLKDKIKKEKQDREKSKSKDKDKKDKKDKKN